MKPEDKKDRHKKLSGKMTKTVISMHTIKLVYHQGFL